MFIKNAWEAIKGWWKQISNLWWKEFSTLLFFVFVLNLNHVKPWQIRAKPRLQTECNRLNGLGLKSRNMLDHLVSFKVFGLKVEKMWTFRIPFLIVRVLLFLSLQDIMGSNRCRMYTFHNCIQLFNLNKLVKIKVVAKNDMKISDTVCQI